MSDGASRRVAWAEETDSSKLRLVINELDEFGDTLQKIDGRLATMAKGTNRRLNWILVTFVTILIAVLGNFVVLVATR